MNFDLEIGVWFLLIIATITDLLWGKVFNLLTFSLLTAGIALRFAFMGPASAGTALMAASFAFVLFFPFYWMKAIHAGDVKLLMALGAWLNYQTVLALAFYSVIVGGLVGGFILFKKTGVKNSLLSLSNHLQTSQKNLKSLKVPFAPAFLCGFMVLKIAESRGWNLF